MMELICQPNNAQKGETETRISWAASLFIRLGSFKALVLFCEVKPRLRQGHESYPGTYTLITLF